MATSKLSTTIDSELIEQIRERVGPRGVSAFVNQALAEKLQKARVLDFLADLERELGAASVADEKAAAAELSKVFRAS
jgi:hypothetical protein